VQFAECALVPGVRVSDVDDICYCCCCRRRRHPAVFDNDRNSVDWLEQIAERCRRLLYALGSGTTTAGLELRDWLVWQGVSLCVMEATSTYWKPPPCLFEDAVECRLVNARDVKIVPRPV
jgi:hypothetical protein